jgi:ATP-binding cassette subfamily B multidrug efflux pump
VAHPGTATPDLKLGTLLAFLIYIRDFFRPLDDLSEKSNVLQAAMASASACSG